MLFVQFLGAAQGRGPTNLYAPPWDNGLIRLWKKKCLLQMLYIVVLLLVDIFLKKREWTQFRKKDVKE